MPLTREDDDQIVEVCGAYAPTTSDATQVQWYGNAAGSLVYDLERQLKRAKAIATMARGLAKLMELDDSITLDTTVREICNKAV